MGITCDRGRWYWVKRVPRRYLGLVLGADGRAVQQVRQALHTDSRAEAQVKAAQIEVERLAQWEALRAGEAGAARAHYEAARRIAAARGLPYRPAQVLAEGDLSDLVARLTGLPPAPARPLAEAVLGTVPPILPDLREVFAEYVRLTATRHTQKSDAQRHRWELPRRRAVENFITVCGAGRAMPVGGIDRAMALRFRAWWSDRVAGGMKIESANKDIGHLSEILGTWARLTETALDNPFRGLRLEGNDAVQRPAFSRDWVAGRLLAPGALDGLNAQARDVFLMMINTGLRPSEITDAPVSDLEVTANVPFLRVAAHGRELKVRHTRRDVPLLGVSLEAARRLAEAGGAGRYRHKAGAWSATVNKYLADHGLRETPAHVAYSLRHYVEDALLAAGVDDRVRADILGHRYPRPLYGAGGALAGRAAALGLIAF
ncbi:site-specific recombinase XerD [Roseovarius sp. MBR-79]